MNKSEQINELAKALSAAQVEMNGAYKDSKNPFFKSNYADLKQVMQVFQSYYAPRGLAVTQLVGIGEITTVLMHSSGQFISTTCSLPVAKQNDPQSLGSSVSYMRRYSLSGLMGLYQTDDDGEAGVGRGPKPEAATKHEVAVKPDQPHPEDGNPHAVTKYIIPVGGYKNRTLEEVGPKALEKYILDLEERAARSGATITGNIKEFIDRASEYIKDWERQNNLDGRSK
jgi:hypothetical protein